MSSTCPQCGVEVPEGHRFCGNCGADLSPAGVAPVEMPPNQAPPAPPQRKGCFRTGLKWAGIAFGVLLLIIIIAAIASPSDDSGERTSEVSATAATRTPRPTSTPRSTNSPRPSKTSRPTNTPAPTDTPRPTATSTNTPGPTDTPLPTATPTNTPEPVVISGSGQYVTDPFALPASLCVAEFQHSGQRNFIVETFQGDDHDLLINTIGAYAGQRPLSGLEPLALAIDADGPWSVRIEPMKLGGTASFSGHGDAVSALFAPPSMGAWEVNHNGSRNFVVLLHCADGSDLVQNEIGPVSGSIMVRFGKTICFWEVEADGDWSLAPR